MSDTEQGSADAGDAYPTSEGSKGSGEAQEPTLQEQLTASEQRRAQRGSDDADDSKTDDMESTAVEDSDDTGSNKSLDVNLACKLIDFKLSPGGQQELEGSSADEFQHTCPTCKKSFRHATTLNRHQKSHQQEIQAEEPAKKKVRPPRQTPSTSPKAEKERDGGTPEKDANGSSVETSGAEEDEREKDQEDRSDEDEDSGSSEYKGGDGEHGSAGKTDKRKKVCNMCNKRFWSLQDLTRHMRSHTGQYKC